jgi:hypothetical protein
VEFSFEAGKIFDLILLAILGGCRFDREYGQGLQGRAVYDFCAEGALRIDETLGIR